MINTRKRYVIKNPVRFVTVIVVCLILFNILMCNNYKNVYGDSTEVEKLEELEQFIEEFSVVPINSTTEKIEEIANIENTKINNIFEDEEFTVTAYDLSVQSCGKEVGSRGYGITKNGFDLRGHTWKTARVIAVDPKVIPLGSIVYIQFSDENYFSYNGVYVAEDTGIKIKGNKIDLFIEDIGEEVSGEAMDFGVTKARIIILNKNGGI